MCLFREDFECILRVYPHKNAVTYLNDREDKFEHLTYKNVQEYYENFCKMISENVSERNCCFGLLMTHNPYIPGLVMSLQTLGHCFVFIDENTAELLKQLSIKWLISFENQSSVFISEDFSVIATLAPELILWNSNLKSESSISFNDVSYVIRTSGTTGTNKIVRVKSYCIYSNIKGIRDLLKISCEDVIYFGTSLTFDPSIVELFLALTTGATLLMLPRKIHANPTKLFNYLFLKQIHGLSVLQMSPSVFLRFASQEIEYIFKNSCLKILCLGGETFPKSLLNFPKREDLKIYNFYGITEMSCWASIFQVESVVYLGDPLPDTLLEVRDENGGCIEDGIGEMFIGSKSRICLVDEETAAPIFRATGDFVEIHNKNYKYIGRKDDTIKRYGTRIVLGDVEEKIFKETQLINKCVWCENELKLLLFFVITNCDLSQTEKILDKLRVKLLHFLPKECYPDYVDILKTIPTTPNGKLDKNALILLSKTVQKPNVNGLDIFNELLLRYFGVSHNKTEATFLELGANSIVLLQFFEEFKSRFSGEITNDFLGMLFERNVEDCRKFAGTLNSFKAQKRKRNDSTETITNLNTGNKFFFKIIWKYDMKACVDCSPIAIKKSDSQTLLAVGSFARIFATIDSISGSKISEITLPETIEAACCPSPCKNYIFVGCFDFSMYCIKIGTGTISWKFPTGDRLKCTPCFCENSNAIVFGSYDGCVYCLSATNGVLIWKRKLHEIINTNPIVSEGRLFVATIAGSCCCLSEHNGEIVWKYSTKQSIFGSPCLLTDATICWSNVNGIINCFSCTQGKLLWTYKTSNQVFCSLLQFKNFVIFGCHDNFLYCLQVQKDSAALKFKTNLNAPITSKSCIFKETFIVTSTTAGSVFLIKLESGEVQAHLNLGAQIFSSPSICDNNKIYLGCRDNNLYCLDVIETIK